MQAKVLQLTMNHAGLYTMSTTHSAALGYRSDSVYVADGILHYRRKSSSESSISPTENRPSLITPRHASEAQVSLKRPSACQERQTDESEDNACLIVNTFSRNLVRIRQSQGLSRVALGKLSDIQISSLYNIETCRSRARLDTIEKLARALGVQPGEFFKESLFRNLY